MKLKSKILLGYGLVLGLMVLVGGWGTFNLRRLGKASDAILQENYRSILAAENIIDAIERQDSAVLLAILNNKSQAKTQFYQGEVSFLQWLGRAKDNITITEEKTILNSLESKYKTYLKTVNLSEITIEQYYADIFPLFTEIRDLSAQLREVNQETMVSASDEAQRVSQQAIWSMILALGTAASLGLIFSLLLADRITKPISQTITATEKIAEGNYEVEITVASQDELGILATEINNMSQKLKVFHELNVGKVIVEQQRNEAIIQSIGDGIIVVDENLNIITLNSQAASLVNLKPQLAVNNYFLDVFENSAIATYLKETITTGKSPKLEDDQKIITIERDNKTKYYQFNITPVVTMDSSTIGSIILLQDITNFKELDKLKSEFVATASHELRTPLTGMAMSLNLLQETTESKLSESEIELLDAANKDVERLRSLVNDLLDLSKIESGRIDLEFTAVEVEFLLNRAIATLQIQAQNKNITLKIEDIQPLPKVKVDANKILWVLTNLIANAIRYTDSEGEIKLQAQQNRDWIYISVQDNGAGIPKEYRSKIFDKFVQVKTEKDVGGTGLGLAICKEIVKAHGGTIWVDSILGEGSTFTFTLPVNKEQ